jgi:hypothetical protein
MGMTDDTVAKAVGGNYKSMPAAAPEIASACAKALIPWEGSTIQGMQPLRFGGHGLQGVYTQCFCTAHAEAFG